MFNYLIRRLVYTLLTLVAVSIVSFLVIQLPPGDFLTSLVSKATESGGGEIDSETLAALNLRYGLVKPWFVQY